MVQVRIYMASLLNFINYISQIDFYSQQKSGPFSAGQGPLLPGGGGRLTAPTLLAMGLQYMLESDTVMGKAVIPR